MLALLRMIPSRSFVEIMNFKSSFKSGSRVPSSRFNGFDRKDFAQKDRLMFN